MQRYLGQIWLLANLSLWAFACTAGDQFSSKNAPEDDRPSEDGETVPGYLTQFDEIGLEIDGESITVFAPEDTVVLNQEDVSIQISSLKEKCVDQGVAAVSPIGMVPVNDNGSFEGTVKSATKRPIVLTVGQTGDKVPIMLAGKVVSAINLRDGKGFRPVHVKCDEQGELGFDPVTTKEKESEKESDPAETTADPDPVATQPTTADTCAAAGFFWDPRELRCETSHPLVRLRHCYPNPNAEELTELIDDKDDFDEGDDIASKLDDKLEDGYTLLTCYNSGPGTNIKIVLLKDDSENTFHIDLPIAPFQTDIQ